MRKIGLGFFLLVFLVSCGNKKTKMDPFATITNLVDSAAHKADTVPQAEVDNDPKKRMNRLMISSIVTLRMTLCNGSGLSFHCLFTTLINLLK